jgi:predicted aspartyl protease
VPARGDGAIVLLLALSACASKAPTPRHVVEEEKLIFAPDSRALKDRSRLREGGKSAQIEMRPPRKAPVVRVNIGGQSAFMLVDSGASAHVITQDVAQRLEVASKASGVSFLDAAGRRQSARTTDASQIAIEGWGKLPSGPLYVVPGDGGHMSTISGIAGLLSPQTLDPSHTIVFDLSREEIHTVDGDQAADPFMFGPQDLGVTKACGNIYFLTAIIEGEPVRMLVDTGADSTLVYGRTATGHRLRMKRAEHGGEIHAVSGPVAADLLASVRMRVGGLLQTRDMTIIEAPGDGCGGEGILGLDVLRNCTLVFGSNPPPRTLNVRCR